MIPQRLGDFEVIPVAFTYVELMSLHSAVESEVRRRRRQNGAAPATLTGVLARLSAVATDVRDTSSSRPAPRVATGRDVLTGRAAASLAPAPDGPVQWLSTSEAAAQLEVSPKTVQRLVGSGVLDGERVDGRGTFRITAASVAAEALRRSIRRATTDDVDPARRAPLAG